MPDGLLRNSDMRGEGVEEAETASLSPKAASDARGEKCLAVVLMVPLL